MMTLAVSKSAVSYSLEMPVSSETSMFTGIVATEEQVPTAVAAGRKRC